MTAKTIAELSFSEKKRFATNVCVNLVYSFLMYGVVVSFISILKIAEPLGNLIYQNPFNTLLSILIFIACEIGICFLFNSQESDTSKYIGFFSMIALRAIYFSPLIIVIMEENPLVFLKLGSLANCTNISTAIF